MNILLITPYLPHPKTGHAGAEYLYGLLKNLSVSHSVTLLTFVDAQEISKMEDVRIFPIRSIFIKRARGLQEGFLSNVIMGFHRVIYLLYSIFMWQPYYAVKYYNRSMASAVQRETRDGKYDIVQIEFSQMAQYVKYVGKGKKVLREHDVMIRPSYRRYHSERSLFKKMLYLFYYCQWVRYERKFISQFDHVLTFTQQDKDIIQRLYKIKKVSYNPRGIEIPVEIINYRNREPFTILFVGTFDHYPNVDSIFWLCFEIFPVVQKKYPQSILYVVGNNPPREVVLASKQNPFLKVLGFVPDIVSYYNRASVFAAPARQGGGIKTKIIHAQSYGLPVVTSPRGAEGITASREFMIVEQSTTGIANGIIHLFQDREKAEILSLKGREAVIQHYAWSATIKKQEELYSQLLLQ